MLCRYIWCLWSTQWTVQLLESPENMFPLFKPLWMVFRKVFVCCRETLSHLDRSPALFVQHWLPPPGCISLHFAWHLHDMTFIASKPPAKYLSHHLCIYGIGSARHTHIFDRHATSYAVALFQLCRWWIFRRLTTLRHAASLSWLIALPKDADGSALGPRLGVASQQFALRRNWWISHLEPPQEPPWPSQTPEVVASLCCKVKRQ